MTLLSFLGRSAGASRKVGPARQPSGPRAHRVLRVEALEGRVVPSQGYTFSTFDPPGSSSSSANGINDLGQIVGSYQAGPVQHGYLLSGGQYTTLDDPNATGPQLPGTNATAINNLGDVAGGYFDNNFVSHGFLFSHGAYVTLDDPNAGTAGLLQGVFPGQGTIASGINDFGQIVGTYTDANNVSHGFLYNHGTFTTLDDPAAGTNGIGTLVGGINDLGQIVGGYFDANNQLHGFLYSNGRFTTLDNPAASTDGGTVLENINNFGQTVGVFFDANFASHAFLYSGGRFTSLDNPNAGTGDAQGTFANGINDFGVIVGQVVGSDFAFAHGLLITPTFCGSGSGGSNAVARPITQPLNGASLVAALTAHDPGLPAGPLGSAVTVGGDRSDSLFHTSATAGNTVAISGSVQAHTDASTARLVDHALSSGSLDPAAFAVDAFVLLAGH